LKSLDDIKKESMAVHELVISSGGNPDDRLEEMSYLLKKLKDFVLSENPVAEIPATSKSGSVKHRSPVIPDEFRCPISLELMQDPVIVSTGQVLPCLLISYKLFISLALIGLICPVIYVIGIQYRMFLVLFL
jgi:U-box domain